MKQEGPVRREAIFWHFPHYRGDIVPYSIIRKGDWKLIKRYEGQPFELFLIEEDPSEEYELAKLMPKKVKELDADLVAWLKDTGGKLPQINPDYDLDVR